MIPQEADQTHIEYGFPVIPFSGFDRVSEKFHSTENEIQK